MKKLGISLLYFLAHWIFSLVCLSIIVIIIAWLVQMVSEKDFPTNIGAGLILAIFLNFCLANHPAREWLIDRLRTLIGRPSKKELEEMKVDRAKDTPPIAP